MWLWTTFELQSPRHSTREYMPGASLNRIRWISLKRKKKEWYNSLEACGITEIIVKMSSNSYRNCRRQWPRIAVFLPSAMSKELCRLDSGVSFMPVCSKNNKEKIIIFFVNKVKHWGLNNKIKMPTLRKPFLSINSGNFKGI